MRSKRRAGALLGYANIVVKNVVNLLYTPLLLAFVGQRDYGVFQTANSFMFSLTLLSFGLSGTYVRFYTQRKVAQDEAGVQALNGLYLLLYSGICMTVVVLGLFGAAHVGLVFADSFLPDEVQLAGSLMRVMTFNVATTLFSTVFDAYVAAHEEFVFQQTRQMFTTLAVPVFALVLLKLGFGALGVAYAQLAVSLVLLALNVRFAVWRLGMRFDVRSPERGLFTVLVTFSAWLFANQICDLINQNVPNVVLGARCGASVVAVFAVSLQIRNVFISLSTTMSSVFVPLVNRMVAESDDGRELTNLMTRVGRWQMMLLGWVYGGFAVVGRFFVGRWAGPTFTDAYWLVLVMVLPLLVPLAQNVGIEIQRAKNLHRTRSVVYLVMALVSVVLTWMLSERLGYWAPAFSYVTSIVLGNCLFMNWYYHRYVGLDMRRYWKRVLPVGGCVATAALMGLLGTRVIPVTGWATFVLWGALYSMVYALALWVLVLTTHERLRLIGLVRRGGVW